MTDEREDAGLDAAPEGASDKARPDTDDRPREAGPRRDRAVEEESAIVRATSDEPGVDPDAAA
jgi:hypothetical protein